MVGPRHLVLKVPVPSQSPLFVSIATEKTMLSFLRGKTGQFVKIWLCGILMPVESRGCFLSEESAEGLFVDRGLIHSVASNLLCLDTISKIESV